MIMKKELVNLNLGAAFSIIIMTYQSQNDNYNHSLMRKCLQIISTKFFLNIYFAVKFHFEIFLVLVLEILQPSSSLNLL